MSPPNFSGHATVLIYIYIYFTKAVHNAVNVTIRVRWVVGSILHGGPTEIFCQCSTTGVTKVVVCVLCCLCDDDAYKNNPCC